MDELLRDLRFALRSFRKHLGFSSVATVSIALGIGATTSIFSVISGVLIDSLPYEEPDELMRVWTTNREAGVERGPFSGADLVSFKEQSQSFSGIAGFYPYDATFTDLEGNAFKIPAQIVTEGFFNILGARPFAGRLFVEEDHVQGGDLMIVLSHGAWRTMFNADPDLIGKSISIEGGSITLVGIAPPGFDFPDKTAAWVSIPVNPNANRRNRFLDVFGRVKPGVQRQTAQADLSLVASQLADGFPDTNRGIGVYSMGLQESIVGELGTVLWILLAASSVLLLVACANVANLLLARGAVRETELALRTALGAGRTRITIQLLTESMVVAGAGAVVGLGMAAGVVKSISVFAPPEMDLLQQAAIDGRVLIFALVTTAVTGVLFGLVPALKLGNPDLRSALTDGGRGATGGSGAVRLRNAFVVTELAMAVVLVVGAGLLVRSFAGLSKTDPGFNSDKLLAFEYSLPSFSYTEWPGISDFYTSFLEELGALPGVTSISAASTLPFGPDLDFQWPYLVQGRAAPLPGAEPEAFYRAVSPGFFRNMGVPMVAGREFAITDRRDGPPVAVINEALARQMFADEDPVTERLTLQRFGIGTLGRYPPADIEIIGVVSDFKYTSMAQAAEPAIYFAFDQAPMRRMTVTLRTSGNPLDLISTIRTETQRIERSAPLGRIESMDRIVAGSFARERFAMLLLGSFAVVALALASVGIYGVISYLVQQRNAELAVRMALGATPGRVVGLVMAQGIRLAGIGVGVGMVGALVSGQILANQLYGITARDPLTLVGVALLLMGVSAVATFFPALRAVRIAPAVALKPK